MKLEGKRIILTGASSGIGKEICLLLAEKNTIFAVARTSSKIPIHPNIIAFPCDISQKENLDILFVEALKIMKKIDLFFANAGFAYYGPFDKADWNAITSIYHTNVFSTIYSLQKMREISGDAPFGFAITASAMSFLSLPGYALYGSTKFALKGFTDAMRFELKKGQQIHMVYPIATRTSFFDVAGAENLPWPRQKTSFVAKKIVKGIEKNKKHIYPACLFRVLQFLNRFSPAFKTYLWFESKKLKAFKSNERQCN